ncbi:MAG: hypothetical protein DHS80DRAFT_31315 [Piptocephalis tieghemiana]|nr:MAG: hypothetical protein DHS80DRAFT_31315 [Piptocephalis tieghemiana]
MEALKQLRPRLILAQILNFALVVSSALALWRGLCVYTNSESPIVVVLSGSMEPAFYRGDLLFLSLPDEPIAVNDICVFKIKGRDIPIVHRALRVHNHTTAGQLVLTKGDNNHVDDRGLYNPGQDWIKREDVVGKVKGWLPYVGMVTIIMNDRPELKFVLLGALALMVLMTRE